MPLESFQQQRDADAPSRSHLRLVKKPRRTVVPGASLEACVEESSFQQVGSRFVFATILGTLGYVSGLSAHDLSMHTLDYTGLMTCSAVSSAAAAWYAGSGCKQLYSGVRDSLDAYVR